MLTLCHSLNGYVFVWGTDLATARPLGLHDAPLFFSSRKAATDAARALGLAVLGSGKVVSRGEP